MDALGTIVLGVQILLLLAGWLLFQQAKSDLTARAAQLPVLSEVKALQKSVAALLEQLKMEAIQTSAQLDTRCAEARDLLSTIDRRLEEARQAPAPARTTRKREPAAVQAVKTEAVKTPRVEADSVGAPPAKAADPRREQVYTLADGGEPTAEIARRTGFSEGEIELILGLRPQVS